MGSKDLTTSEMLDVSGTWVTTSSPAGALLAGHKRLSPLVGFVRDSHDQLSKFQVATTAPANEAKLKELADKNVALDRRHDSLARCIMKVLGGLAEGAKTKSRRALYLDTSLALFPAGAASTQKSYAGQAGSAASVEERLKPEHRELLASISTPDGTLADHVSRWKKRAKELGDSDKERTRLANDKVEGTSKSDVIDARNQWIRSVDVLVRAVSLAGLPEKDALEITQAFAKATDRATRRGNGKGENVEEEADTGAPVDDVPEGDQG